MSSISLKEKLFLISSLGLLPAAAVFLTRVINIVQDRIEQETASIGPQPIFSAAPTNGPLTHPKWADIAYALGISVAMCMMRWILSETVLKRIGERVVAKREERAARVARFSGSLFKFIYFVIICWWGWSVLLPQNWMPKVLGGNGHYREGWMNYPTINVDWTIKQYYLIQLGYHVHSLVYHGFFVTRRNDFMEMLLHHLIATFLVSLSYILNYLRPGSIILLLHDMADVFVYGAKIFVDTKYKALTLLFYFGMLTSWAFARLYVFPFHVLWNVWFESFHLIHGASFFFAMLVMLQCLHIYWYLLFIKMGLMFLSSKDTVDIQNKLADDEGKKQEQMLAAKLGRIPSAKASN